MNKLIEFNVAGGTVVVESHDAVMGSPMRGGGLVSVTEKVGRSLEEALSVIRPVANAAFSACQDLVPPPGQVEVDFSLKIDVELGAFIAKTSAEGTFNIKLVWKPE
jgi:hypothetical protein